MIRLLENGINAFEEIINCIRRSGSSIYVNMFIWRDDTVGNRLAKELLDAADRGVMIYIRKDRCGAIPEYSEEDKSSFFTESLSLTERIKCEALLLTYNPGIFLMPYKRTDRSILNRMLKHPNIRVSVREYADHSKFFIFDRHILIFGGINVEDKEEVHDRHGRRWRDFMVKIDDREQVSRFISRLRGIRLNGADIFAMNNKRHGRDFEMKDTYLRIINEAEAELTILMAYFDPLPEFIEAIAGAVRRNVRVRILVPYSANYLNAANRRTINILSGFLDDGDLSLYMSDEMVHAKLLMNEKEITLGSCNITARSFDWLGELNLVVRNGDDDFSRAVRASAGRIIDSARYINKGDRLFYDPVLARIETKVI